MAAQGYTNGEIAKQIGISQRTVEVHRTNMMRKLNLHSQTDLIRYALKHQILPP
ncbi:MAG: LuxR C-terminal-related transcriptional regulator [Dehalococcoidia bacterium]|nr:LuxR C-terminal-related transcriptional regulator [Dehalococcoidia bacterium]